MHKQNQIKITQLHKGSRKAFRDLFDSMYPALFHFGKKYTGENYMVEDFIQEAFIAFWSKRKDFDNLLSVKSYLYTAVRNSCMNYLAHQKVKLNHEDELKKSSLDEAFFAHNVIEEETFNLLYREIKNLPAATQEVMLLALNGLKNPEIASELSVSVNTVKTLKKKAYATLRQKLPSDIKIFFLLMG